FVFRFFFFLFFFFFFSSRRRHTRFSRDWSSDVCSSDLVVMILLFSALLVLSVVASDAVVFFGTGARSGRILSLIGGWLVAMLLRSEERRVGKECRSRWAAEY